MTAQPHMAAFRPTGKWPPKLSAGPTEKWPLKLSAELAAIEDERARIGASKAAVSRAAGLNGKFLERLLLAPSAKLRPSSLAKLRAGLRRLAADRAPGTAAATDTLIRTTFQGFLAGVSVATGADVAAVRAQLARPGECTLDPAWRAASHLRQAALNLTNTALGVPQVQLARALGLTPAAVCLAVRAVEDRRDDPAFDRALAAAELFVTGRDA